ncbi:hypothetical protein [Enterococcus rivorum]|uniref:Uncharacterized protein n=2 Tax=Enterococcus rivorum TaxID=762845 RepID=A0A1E5KXJ5_9ENTE|nr:hypothetical protein [Enterococcus rivorum]MBP2099898.1 hypothetical protein [Enterococcus rivorum]OEH82567.1 hypothetical protein BCR26_13020 [Enterococcus rivorum]
MPKFYKNMKTGAVITEAEYKEKIMVDMTEVSSDMGTMGMGSYSNFVNSVFEGEVDNYSEYVPYDPEAEEE